MATLGQSSFRRILLLRILLLSIPILFLGMAVTFRRARASLLDTARQNLEQSAVRKADTIHTALRDLQTGLAIASETSALQYGSPAASKVFLNQLQKQLPTDVQCLQLRNLQANRIVATTCGDRILDSVSTSAWAKQRNLGDANRLQIHTLTLNRLNSPPQINFQSQLNLLMSTPVYNTTGQLVYSLTAQTVLKQPESIALLQGYTVVIAADGTLLAHPLVNRVGLNTSRELDQDRFQDILTNVQRGDTGSRHLFGLTLDQTEWVAGFSPLTIPISATESQTWTVLAVTRLDSALQGLENITQTLLILTAGLLAAHLLAMLYMARDLALPIEQLGKYAQRIHKRDALERDSLERAPRNFRIRELNHLAEVLDNMVGRREEHTKELESALQDAEAANQLKSEFLANTSHELRTPLNAIIGCIRLVKDDCCDSKEEENEFLGQADKAAIHLLKIINDLLDIQRIEEEKLPLTIETVDLRNILKETIDIESAPIQQKGLQLSVTPLPEPLMIRADAARLKQVLLNVVYNAIKFTDQGGITIEVQLEQIAAEATYASSNGHHLNGAKDDDDEAVGTKFWVIIAISDTGIGIDPVQQHKLFRPFVMVDGTTTRKFEGTGLGLAISRNLVEMMGGHITLHSEGLGHGTTVKIAIPVLEDSFNDITQNPVREAAINAKSS
ncbi:MAG: two-component sensor histidine kinase [Drouetiella hepatica Uher 2000/2452]|jgi:signal transduction histidine kinase|uniref:Circadian input-output histidine kinase CikA n=1 Tax=Drouetiella hepatica Uher 2000/2452 TaxID=904376 RepID=A0A951Q8W0_9CYAN|nr:two-component sensor histidine kinase [Drouetiella hepatica Uher 2000/2452]